jgi:hypothetical protein
MDEPMPLLGVIALEILGLKVNPVEETIEYSRPFGPAALLGYSLQGLDALDSSSGTILSYGAVKV